MYMGTLPGDAIIAGGRQQQGVQVQRVGVVAP